MVDDGEISVKEWSVLPDGSELGVTLSDVPLWVEDLDWLPIHKATPKPSPKERAAMAGQSSRRPALLRPVSSEDERLAKLPKRRAN